MSKPTTPRSRYSTASSAIRRNGWPCDGGEQHADANAVAGRCRQTLTLGEPGEHLLDDLVLVEPLLDVQFGREAHFGVDDAISSEVLSRLPSHPAQGVGGLSDADGVGERLEVALQ
jgi:hypothetical protein